MESLAVLGFCTTGKFQSEQSRFRNTGNPVRATSHCGQVIQQNTDNLAKTERHDRQIVTAQTQYRETQQEAGKRSDTTSNRQRFPER